MYTSLVGLLGLFMLSATEPPVATETYEVDAEHTFLSFKVERFGMVDVVGMFPEVTGVVTYNADDPSQISAEVTVQTGSVYSGHSEGRLEAIKGQFFLDTETYPTMTFATKRVFQEGNQLMAVGDLTIKDTTKEVTFPFTVKPPFTDPTGVNTIAIAGKLTINRSDFNVFMDRKLPNGAFMIGQDVAIELNVLAIQSE